MKTLRTLIERTKSKGVSAWFGKGRIPTIGHKIVIDQMRDQATKAGNDIDVTLFGQHGPLTIEQRKRYGRKIFGVPINVDKTGNAYANLARLYKDGYRTLDLFAGSDRAADLEDLLQRTNGKKTKSGEKPAFNFLKWQVHTVGDERQESDDRSTDMPTAQLIQSVSATKLEDLARHNDLEQFKAYYPSIDPTTVTSLFREIRAGLNKQQNPRAQ